MSKRSKIVLALALAVCAGAASAAKPAPTPNGIDMPEGYKNWRIIGVAHRTDNNTVRAILGNDAAVAAARAGKTNPWPDGAILAKLVWKATANKHWDKAIVPGDFVHAEFMHKDSKKYASTGGWGYARWVGMDQKPYGKDANVAQECVACHTPVKSQDWVFTQPAVMP